MTRSLFHDKGSRDPIYDWVYCYKSEIDKSQAFLRTLVADFVLGKRATKSDVEALDDWILLKKSHLGVEDLGDRIKLLAYLVEVVSAAWNGRRFFISEKEHMGLAPITARAGIGFASCLEARFYLYFGNGMILEVL